MNTKIYTFDRVVRLVIGMTVLTLLFLLVQRLSNVLLPFLVAWLLAYLLQPIVGFFQYKLKLRSRVLSITCTLLLFIGAIIGLGFYLVPLISHEFSLLSNLVYAYSQDVKVNTFLPPAWQNEIVNYISHLNIETLLKDETLMSGVKKIAPQLWNLINGSLDFVLGLAVVVIILLYLIFILLDYEKINASWFAIIPPKYRGLVSDIIHDLENGMNGYFRGQALVSIIVGILFAIGFSIIQLPMAVIMGLMFGLLTMVPYLKSILIIPCLGLGLLQSAETGQSYGSILIGIMIVFFVIQFLEDLFLTPKIMGKVTGLNPAVILLSLSVWGSLMGVLGMIIALPITTLIISYYKRFVLKETQTAELPDEELLAPTDNEVS